MTVAVMVFTRDLRLADNPALAAAARAAAVVPLFVLDEAVLRRAAGHPNRLGFLLDSLHDLDTGLRGVGGSLVVRAGPWAATVLQTARAAGAGRIHVAADVSGYAARRLDLLERTAAAARIAVVRHPGITAVEPAAIRTASGGPYQVFTPYYRRWLAASRRPVAAGPSRLAVPDGVSSGRLPRLAELSTVARAPAAEMSARPGGAAFVRQLAWRDFFHQALAARPDAAWRDYRDRGDTWRDDPEGLAAWQQGRTGYPAVDAAMRQLAQEGFMPNRARMIAASFLTNDLHLDWRGSGLLVRGLFRYFGSHYGSHPP